MRARERERNRSRQPYKTPSNSVPSAWAASSSDESENSLLRVYPIQLVHKAECQMIDSTSRYEKRLYGALHIQRFNKNPPVKMLGLRSMQYQAPLIESLFGSFHHESHPKEHLGSGNSFVKFASSADAHPSQATSSRVGSYHACCTPSAQQAGNTGEWNEAPKPDNPSQRCEIQKYIHWGSFFLHCIPGIPFLGNEPRSRSGPGRSGSDVRPRLANFQGQVSARFCLYRVHVMPRHAASLDAPVL